VDFLWHLVFANELARDLDPEVAGALTGRTDNRRDVPIFSVATWSPPPADGDTGDRLFRDLWTWTQVAAEGATPKPPAIELGDSVVRVASDPTRLPASAFALDPRGNDGVVNTDRQVFGTLAALVLGDHGDVIGRYRRTDPLDDSILDSGLLTSGADFGDEQFFHLTGVVGRLIAGAM
jgi:hypothetical protein